MRWESVEKRIVVIYNWENCDPVEFIGHVEAFKTCEKQPFRSINELESILATVPPGTIEHRHLKLVLT
jgi:hypothetical protein